MGLICTDKDRDGVVYIATILRAGRSGAQIPILAIDFYLLQKVIVGSVVRPSLGMRGAIYSHSLTPCWHR